MAELKKRHPLTKSVICAGAVALYAMASLGACAQPAEEPEDDDSQTTALSSGAATSGAGGTSVTVATGVTTTTGVTSTNTTTGATTTGTTTASTTAATTTGGTPMCLDSEDCMGANVVCDPQTAMCDSNIQCDANVACPNNMPCLGQVDMPTVGACYDACNPSVSNSCGANEECLDISGTGTEGACFRTGPGAPKQACTPHDISTDCQAGYVCSGDPAPVCEQLCSFWGSATCTAGGDRCWLGGVCRPDPVDSASIGNLCIGVSGTPCGVQGDRAAGVCIDVGAVTECLEWCRMGGNDCGGGLICTDVGLTIPVGVCF